MDTQLFHKAALIPLIPRLCKIHSISRHLQASHAKLFTTTDQFNWTLENTGTYIVSLWLAFLTSVQQGRALECMPLYYSTAWVCIAKPTKNISLYYSTAWVCIAKPTRNISLYYSTAWVCIASPTRNISEASKV